MPAETELEMVRRHVRQGLLAVKRQRELVIELQDKGAAAAETALALLDQFKDLQQQHEAHLARLEKPGPASD